MKTITLTSLLIISSLFNISIAAPGDFKKGPVFENHGENAMIDSGLSTPESQKFKVVFDVFKENESKQPHRGFNSIARFINMHVRAGVPLENIDVALVVHGKASYDLMQPESFSKHFNKENPSSDLLGQLLQKDVKIFICGQSSSYLGLQASEFNKGVKISLSAMTANALLQQQGYTLNPF